MSIKSMDDIAWCAHHLREWYLRNKRDLPWRNHPSPYQVWVSELMLQQTQVVTVLPYYARWMERFPSIQALANADISEVLQLWAGLGYYRRARFLHEGAQIIVNQFGGEFPQNIADLKKIRGIGEYTAGAIAAFAFHQNIAAIDGNAERVLARFFGITGDLTRGVSRKVLENTANAVAACGNASDTNQAIMDLGTSCCAKIAHCASCPLAERCFALKNGRTESLPEKKAPPQKSTEFRACLILIDAAQNCLIARRRSDLLLGGLWEFPMITISKNAADAPSQLRLPRQALWRDNFGDMIHGWHATDKQVTHIFTHIKMTVVIDTAQCSDFGQIMQMQTDTYDAFACAKLQDIAQTCAISTLMKKLITAALKPGQKTLPI